MSLQISPKDSDLLLKQKNIITPNVIAKYQFAGRVTQTCLNYLIELINDSYHLGKHEPYSAAELCLLGDSFMKTLMNKNFKKFTERGIAQPVTIDVNDIVMGYSPEIDDETNNIFQIGDIVTINLGCHVDGYTSNVSHTVVIFPPGTKNENDDSIRPSGPLLGSSADAICASYFATESIVALLGAAMTPEKIPQSIAQGQTNVTGSMIRNVVNEIAKSFNCVVVPTSKVRRIRRFLAGQAEGVVAERNFKGVVWSESDQEKSFLEIANQSSSTDLTIIDESKTKRINNESAIPTDEFVILPGEVYSVDIKMCPLNLQEPGIVTLESLDAFSGKNLKSEFNPKHTVFIRDVSVSEQLKLKSARKLYNEVEKKQSVYPFKISHVSENFPLNLERNILDQLQLIQNDMKSHRLGVTEAVNKHLFATKPILAARFVPLRDILKVNSATGVHGFDAENPTLPGLELPLPRLGVTALKLKSMIKGINKIPVARETCTVILDNNNTQLIRLGGGTKPSWVQSEYQLQGYIAQGVNELSQLTQDERFGIKIKECRVINMETGIADEAMDLE